MNTGHVVFSSVLLLFVNLYDASCKGTERNAVTGKDTIILAGNQHSFKVDGTQSFFQAELTSTGKNFSDDKKLLLLFDRPINSRDPEGVYEVYVTRESPDVKTLSSFNPGFVNVLDIYVLTADAPPHYLVVDLSKKSGEWAKDGQAIPSLIVTVKFRGNVSPDNTESKQAGQLSVKGIRIVQEK